jgi:hypothetical protein
VNGGGLAGRCFCPCSHTEAAETGILQCCDTMLLRRPGSGGRTAAPAAAVLIKRIFPVAVLSCPAPLAIKCSFVEP